MTESNEPLFRAWQEQRGEAVVVRASGELDAFSVDELVEQLEAVEKAETPPATVLLDLTELTYLSSAGIATLIIHSRRYAEFGRRLCVVADQPAVLRPITLTGAEKAIDVVPTLDEAVDTGS